MTSRSAGRAKRSGTKTPERRGSRGRGTTARPPRRRRWRRWLLGLLVLPALMLGAIGLLAFYLVFSSVPLPPDIAADSSVVLDRDGTEVGGLAAEVTREDVALATLPVHVGQAVLAAEDRGFYEHRGISLPSIARALFVNIRAGSVQQGGSTITQQYIKNATLTPEQTYRRKVEEAALAIKLEQSYTKDEILGFYLNTIYWGRGTYGIEAAAQAFFGVAARDLDVNQAATLAGIIAAPEAFDPLDNPEGAEGRRRYTLNGMLEMGTITRAEHDALVALGLPEVSDRIAVDRGPNAYYLDAVRRELSARPEFSQGELFRGLRIHTHLDQPLQAAAQDVLTRAVVTGPTDTGAIVTVEPGTGAVLALVGGPDVAVQPFNTAVRSVRQVGSTFKAFTLQAHLAAGHSPEDRFPAPAELEVDSATIRNFGGNAFGQQTVRQATASSTNTVYVQLQEQVGRDAVADAAVAAGLPEDKPSEVFASERAPGPAMQRGLAGLTLGQDVFTPLELAGAYATFAAEGLRVRPRLVVRIEDRNGRVVWQPGIRDREAMDVEVARGVTDVLATAVRDGSGRAATLADRPVAGKTGTTSDARDVWFVGYVPQLATAVWLGNLDNSPIEAENATGGGLAAPVWQEYMTRAVADLEVLGFTAPDPSRWDEPEEVATSCPEGYAFADPPAAVDDDGFFPDILLDIVDADGRPCVQLRPEPPPECPPGFAFGEVPPPGTEPMPEVRDDILDADGRPCVELDPQPAPEPDPEPAPDPDPEPEPEPDPGPAPDPDPEPDPEPDPGPAPDPDPEPDPGPDDGDDG